jgi:hypothetical protein
MVPASDIHIHLLIIIIIIINNNLVQQDATIQDTHPSHLLATLFKYLE